MMEDFTSLWDENMNKTILAIDFGTTTTVFAATTDCDEFAPKILEIDRDQTPESALRFTQEGTAVEMVGDAAWERAVEAPDRTAFNFKLDIGSSKKLPVVDGRYDAKDVSIFYLATLREKLEHDVWNGGEIGSVVYMTVVGYPAEWTEVQRKETIEIVERAGFPNVIGCSEPIAAVYYYHYVKKIDAREFPTILVYDLGGGTADVCLVRGITTEGQPDIRAKSGSQNLGGRHIDEILCQHFSEILLKEAGLQSLPPQDLIRLRRGARRIKEKLSQEILNNQFSADVTIARLDSIGSSYRLSLTQESFEAICRSIIEETEKPVWDVLDKADVKATDIDAVILVGGASALYFVKNKLQKIFPGKPIIADTNQQHIVTKGLAIFGRMKLIDRVLFKKSVNNSKPESYNKEICRHDTSGQAPSSTKRLPLRFKLLTLMIIGVSSFLHLGGLTWMESIGIALIPTALINLFCSIFSLIITRFKKKFSS